MSHMSLISVEWDDWTENHIVWSSETPTSDLFAKWLNNNWWLMLKIKIDNIFSSWKLDVEKYNTRLVNDDDISTKMSNPWVLF